MPLKAIQILLADTPSRLPVSPVLMLVLHHASTQPCKPHAGFGHLTRMLMSVGNGKVAMALEGG